MLQLRRSASAIDTVSPGPHVPPLALRIVFDDWGSCQMAGFGICESGV